MAVSKRNESLLPLSAKLHLVVGSSDRWPLNRIMDRTRWVIYFIFIIYIVIQESYVNVYRFPAFLKLFFNGLKNEYNFWTWNTFVIYLYSKTLMHWSEPFVFAQYGNLWKLFYIEISVYQQRIDNFPISPCGKLNKRCTCLIRKTGGFSAGQ